MVQSLQKSPSILAVDDHPLFLSALRELLNVIFPHHSIITCHTAEEGLVHSKLNVDIRVIILDFSLPFLAGHTAIDAYIKRFPGVPLVIFSGIEDRQVAQKALALGVSGFFSKSTKTDFFCRFLLQLLEGKQQPIVSLSDNNLQSCNLPAHATPRQNQVLECLSRGLTNKQIATDLHVSEITVKKHLSALFHLFNVRNRYQLVIRAKNSGVVD